jgi:hypothetical protein
MSQFSHEMRRRLERRTHRQPRTPEDARRALARDILARIHEKQADDPDVAEFQTGLNTPIGRLETYLLRHQRKEIIARMALDHTVSMVLDEEAEPPVLHITLGDRPTDGS